MATDNKQQIIYMSTESDFRKLSYYTLCCLQSSTHYANPICGLPDAIKRGEFLGRLTMDQYGNYIEFM